MIELELTEEKMSIGASIYSLKCQISAKKEKWFKNGVKLWIHGALDTAISVVVAEKESQ